jgi:glucose/arabinose dehydrogenase
MIFYETFSLRLMLGVAMRKIFHVLAYAVLFALPTAACADIATLPYGADMGPNPKLVQPQKSVIPTMKIAEIVGWPEGKTPITAPGLTVKGFARDLDHPRWIYVLPNNDVLVAESNTPPKPDDNKGIKGFFTKMFMKKAGGADKSANRITLLRDADNDGVAEIKTAFLENLNSPIGMALVDNFFYVANTDAVMRFPYTEGQTRITEEGYKLADLPGGDLNHHWTKSMIASLDGKYLYVGVGSNSNVGENGLEKEVNRAAILEIARETGHVRLFASGLRNPVGMSWNPATGELWTSVNERDELGSDLVPDYMTSVKDGGFYGWPYSYYGGHVDERPQPSRPDLVAKAIKPDYALGAHTASLGLTFYTGDLLPAKYKGGAFVGQHGSWNRDPPSGYKVVFIPFRNGKPAADIPQDILTGFLNAEKGEAYGRPVGVIQDKRGALLVADDGGNIIWRVTPSRTVMP